MLRIAVAGAMGRMGRAVAVAAAEVPGMTVVAGIVRAGSPAVGSRWDAAPAARLVSDPASALPDIDVLVDFTAPGAVAGLAAACVADGRPLVCGTTGLSGEELAALETAAAAIPVFYARNMSLGVHSLVELLPALALALRGYDVEIIETHHRHKTDAPSGTALVLAEAIATARGVVLDGHMTHGRSGIAPRQPGEIGIHSVRAGSIPGEHTILFANEGEEIRIVHRAAGRQTFALGALDAARFVANRAPGWYGMADLARSLECDGPDGSMSQQEAPGA